MEKEEIQNVIAQAAHLIPEAHSIEISYEGSGDEFSDFYSMDALTESGVILGLSGDTYVNVRSRLSPMWEEFSDMLFDILDKMGADFNNDGSKGTITIDLKKLHVDASNYNVIVSYDEEFNSRYEINDDDEEATDEANEA